SSDGIGGVNWTARPEMLSSRDANWLSVTPSSGSATGGQTGLPVSVSVKQTGLLPGQYYGSITINAPNASNNPQSLLVLLNVAGADASSANIGLSTSGLIFTVPSGTTTNQQQQISLFNPSNSPVNYSATLATSNGNPWLSLSPA